MRDQGARLRKINSVFRGTMHDTMSAFSFYNEMQIIKMTCKVVIYNPAS